MNKTSDSLKKHIPALIVGPTLKMIEAIFDLLIPLFMKSIIDLTNNHLNGYDPLYKMSPISRGISKIILGSGTWVDNKALNYALIGGVFILAMGVLGFLTTMITQYVAARTAVAVGKEVRQGLYEKILKLSKKDREKVGTAKLVTVLNSDTYQVQQGVLIFIRLIVRAPFIILGALTISFILYWQIGLVFLAIIPLILLVIFLIMKKSSKEYLTIQSKLDNISLKTSDTINGAKVIRAFNSEEMENKSFEEKTSDYQSSALHVQKLNALINPLTFSIIAIATVAVVVFGGLPILSSTDAGANNELSSTIITEIAYLAQIFTTLVQLTNVVLVLTKASVSKKRVDEIFAIDESIKDAKDAKEETIKNGDVLFSFDNVSLRYKDSGNYTLKNISFSLKKGESLGIIGGTGSGKSTLVSLFLRFIDATEGNVIYKGKPIKDYPLTSLRSEISLVPQKSVLFKGTVRSNMAIAKKDVTDLEIESALKDSLAYDFIKANDEYLDYGVEEGGRNFSGGQRQRLCIARALVKDSELLILDDSTSALDLLTDRKVRDNIKNNHEGLSKVIISQRVSTVKDCNQIIVLEAGRLVAIGTHEELLKDCSIYRETFESQTKKESN